MELTQEYLKECLDYNPEAGIFIRKARPITHFKSRRAMNAWNARFAGKLSNRLCQWGYLNIKIDKNVYKAHRLAWLYVYGELPVGQIDHINHDKLDNRITNLRQVTQSQNQRNMIRRKDNKSGLPGIHYSRSINKWIVQVSANQGRECLGAYEDKFEAICVRKTAEIKYNFHENHGRAI
jgi:hypothetical protein